MAILRNHHVFGPTEPPASVAKSSGGAIREMPEPAPSYRSRDSPPQAGCATNRPPFGRTRQATTAASSPNPEDTR